MDRGHETLEHAADMGIRGWGGSPAEALEELAEAMFGLEADIERIEADAEAEVDAAGEGLEELMITFLNALLSEADLREMVFVSVKVLYLSGRGERWSARGSAAGTARTRCRGELLTEVKAATWYGASFTELEDGTWIAECVVDL